jgi:hypothetical protein
VSKKPAAPVVTEVGDRLSTIGTGLDPIVKGAPLPVPMLGAGLATVTVTTPAEARSAAGMAAVNCVELTIVVDRMLPLQSTCDEERKPLPLTVSVMPEEPTATDGGESELTTAIGL